MDGHDVTRREFLGASAGIGAAGVLAPAILKAGVASAAANERVRVGFIGVGTRGIQIINGFLREPGAEIVAMCDVWQERLDAAVAKCPQPPRTFHDYRDLLAQEDVDAVIIATPPHWHTLMAIHACEAGKDFYLEKPMTISVGESLAVARAVRKHGRITQIGTQIHADPNYRRVVDIVRSGVLGKLSMVQTLNVGNQGVDGLGREPDCAPPEGLDWELWCGPAPKRAFNPILAKGAYEHSSFLDYSAGWTPGMAPHILDLPFWALELGLPTNASGTGGRYALEDVGDCYDTHHALWKYPDFTLTWMTSIVNGYGMAFPTPENNRRTLAIAFHGANGTLVSDYNTFDILPERRAVIDVDAIPETTPASPGHYREWLECIRTREQPSCHVGYHYKIDVAIHLSLMAMKLGRSVQFDPKREIIPRDREANALLFPRYRAPWRIPREYV